MARFQNTDSPRASSPGKPKRKRGVILLLVVSLLALFVLIGVTYAVLATGYLHTTKIEVRKEEYGDLPEKEFDLVLGQLLYDTFSRSAMRYHSLLGDLYGNDTVFDDASDGNQADDTKVFSTAAPNGFIWGGQAYAFQLLPGSLQSQGGPLVETLDYYTGRVLTFTEGQAQNYSARILQYDPTMAGGPQFIIELDYSSHETVGQPAQNDHFAINGAPFNGPGAGYDYNQYGNENMEAVYGDFRSVSELQMTPSGYIPPPPTDLVAMLPHFNGFDPTAGRVYLNPAGYANAAPNGAQAATLDAYLLASHHDESWDAVDFQNMFLAMVPPTAAASYTDASAADNVPILPSYHRPELVYYWVDFIIDSILVPAGVTQPNDQYRTIAQPYGPNGIREPGVDDSVVPMDQLDRIYGITRGCIFRPMPWDHPNFTGSSQQFAGSFDASGNITNAQQLLTNLINNTNLPLWDVDNDNDQVPDSIWIDPGLPVVTSPDGKRYKRMVSILVKDMDGRLDLNAHGNLSQLNTNHQANQPLATALGLAAAGQTIPRGMGFGPAEVNFLNIFGNDNSATGPYATLMRQRYSSNLVGTGPTNDTGNTAGPGSPNDRDGISIVKHHGMPNNYGTLGGWYSSPPDVWGRGAYVLDYGGQPISAYSGLNGEMLDNPYEISLSGELNNADSPYTLVEMERLLRFHDPDAQYLPSERWLAANAYLGSTPGVIDANHANRERLRVHGAHLPVPGTVAPSSVNGATPVDRINRQFNVPGQTTILDLYVQRLSVGGSSNVAQDFYKIVPWELRQGGKFNLNRWLGDGFDSPVIGTDNVADDPVEAFNDPANGAPFNLARETAWLGGPTGYTNINAEHSNGVDVDGVGGVNALDRALARHLYARHLFCLAMLFFDNGGFNAAFPHDTSVNGNPLYKRELYVRRIAQWAVNVVDFRDSDAIMTPFEYDVNPWNGWSVDGVLGSTDDTLSERRLVWGTETPDVMLTETLAFHSKNVKDSTQDNGDGAEIGPNAGDDNDMDQFRVPEGSLFIELYCPRPYRWQGAPANQAANQKPRLPAELYDLSNPNNPRLDLGRVSPTAGGWPTWRLAISPLTYGDADLTAWKPSQMSVTNPESSSFETAPSAVTMLPTNPMGQFPIERYVWFATPAAATAAVAAVGQNSFFFNDTGNLLGSTPYLQPGQYAIVGPRPTTYLGSLDPADPNSMPVGEWGGYALQRFDLTGTGIQVTDLMGAPIATPPVRDAVPIVVDTGPITPAGWMDPQGYLLPRTVGLNISEPMPLAGYYPEPMLTAAPAAGVPRDVYDDPAMPANLLPDEPYDGRPGFPLGDRNMAHSGTYDDCASVFLQRLANPNLPWNAQANPYLTVDWASIDLTVFNGDDYTRSAADMPVEPEDDPAQRPNMGNFHWLTRQRGFPQGGPMQANPWPPLTNFPGPASMAGGSVAYFDFQMSANTQTFGYINNSIALPAPATGPVPAPPNVAPYLGEPVDATGQPAPFPWLAHLNRPLANPFELLLVPSSSQSRLCSEFSPGFTFGGAAPDSLYTTSRDENLRAPFGHLVNFFHSDAQVANSPQWQRLLDYVEVPSPYSGAERWYNPANFGTAGLYRPPFNKMSRFRDPGLININTIFDSEVWNSAISQFPGMNTQPFVDKVSRSRRGFTGGPLSQTDGSGNPIPTLFGNPIRPSDAADLMPNLTIGGVPMRRPTPVESTLLRPDPDTPAQPLFDNQVTDTYQDARRNAYFRYQALQKLGNTFTTHSNVFAVWMTVGYFEVESSPNGVTAAHPDGLRLGAEIGADSGEIVRHRSFFIIDRSVPVGYVHGQKLNTDNCVLLRRMIE
jgi:hypothetical protein